jgi:hypothetical protein
LLEGMVIGDGLTGAYERRRLVLNLCITVRCTRKAMF